MNLHEIANTSRFRVGARVAIADSRFANDQNYTVGARGTVTGGDETRMWYVQFDEMQTTPRGSETDGDSFEASELVLV